MLEPPEIPWKTGPLPGWTQSVVDHRLEWLGRWLVQCAADEAIATDREVCHRLPNAPRVRHAPCVRSHDTSALSPSPQFREFLGFRRTTAECAPAVEATVAGDAARGESTLGTIAEIDAEIGAESAAGAVEAAERHEAAEREAADRAWERAEEEAEEAVRATLETTATMEEAVRAQVEAEAKAGAAEAARRVAEAARAAAERRAAAAEAKAAAAAREAAAARAAADAAHELLRTTSRQNHELVMALPRGGETGGGSVGAAGSSAGPSGGGDDHGLYVAHLEHYTRSLERKLARRAARDGGGSGSGSFGGSGAGLLPGPLAVGARDASPMPLLPPAVTDHRTQLEVAQALMAFARQCAYLRVPTERPLPPPAGGDGVAQRPRVRSLRVGPCPPLARAQAPRCLAVRRPRRRIQAGATYSDLLGRIRTSARTSSNPDMLG